MDERDQLRRRPIIQAEPFDAVEIDLLPVWGESRG